MASKTLKMIKKYRKNSVEKKGKSYIIKKLQSHKEEIPFEHVKEIYYTKVGFNYLNFIPHYNVCLLKTK